MRIQTLATLSLQVSAQAVVVRGEPAHIGLHGEATSLHREFTGLHRESTGLHKGVYITAPLRIGVKDMSIGDFYAMPVFVVSSCVFHLFFDI